MTGLKLLHRNLYVARGEQCLACEEEESQLHLCSCGVIHDEYWKELIQLMIDADMPTPHHVPTFLATGAISDTAVMHRYVAIIWFIGWRCLYAALTQARIDDTTLKLKPALQRATAMIISRLKAYGYGWRRWVETGQHITEPRVIPKQHRDKKLIYQDEAGDYEIHGAIFELARKLQIDRE